MDPSPYIKNTPQLATSPEREVALAIAETGLQAIATTTVIQQSVALNTNLLTVGGHEYDLSHYGRLFIVGVGKCSLDAAVELEALLGERITDGLVIDVRDDVTLKHVRVRKGTHPYPSEENIRHTRELLDLLAGADEHDLVLGIISGGGSTLLCQPKTHTADDETKLVRYLFQEGATIEELNVIRKHLSLARGGNLAAAVHPAALATLIFSDVPGDDLAVISSGATVLDHSTKEDARNVLERFRVAETIGFSPEHLLETPKDPTLFSTTDNTLALTNMTALSAMAKVATEHGYHPQIVDTRLTGIARTVAEAVVTSLHGASSGTVLLYGGETTVTITGHGVGGRNQELVLAAVPLLAEGEAIISLASDGHDNSDHAGAIADATSVEKAKSKNLDASAYLADNNSFTFFHLLEDALVTGYTGANIADLVIAIKRT